MHGAHQNLERIACKRFFALARKSQTYASPVRLEWLSDQVPTRFKRLNGLCRGAAGCRLKFRECRADPGLTHYLEEIRRCPMLERQEEYMLAKRWRERGDRNAAHKLVTSHLRLVTKIARDYRGYGLPISEAISEGNVGLMQAVERFEPEKGFRLATYAMWWINAAIQEYILRS